MNKPNSTRARRRLLAAFAGVGIVLGLGVSAFLASISGNNDPVVATSSQTIEVNTSKPVATPAATISPEATEAAKPGASNTSTTAKAVAPKPSATAKQTIVDSSKRVTVTPKPVTSPTPAEQANTSGGSTTVPAVKSPTEGYIRPTVSFLGATSCSAVSDGWRITIAWKVSGGNFIGRFYGQNSGLKTPGDSWTISVASEIGSTDAPTGVQTFRTEGDFIWFMGMDGSNQVIDEIWMPDRVTADVTGLCR